MTRPSISEMSRYDLELWADMLESEMERLQQMIADELPEGRIPDGYRLCSDWWAEQVTQLGTAQRRVRELEADRDRVLHRNQQEWQRRDRELEAAHATIVNFVMSVFGPQEIHP